MQWSTGRLPLRDAGVDDVDLLLRWLKDGGVGVATRKQVHAMLNTALNAGGE